MHFVSFTIQKWAITKYNIFQLQYREVGHFQIYFVSFAIQKLDTTRCTIFQLQYRSGTLESQ